MRDDESQRRSPPAKGGRQPAAAKRRLKVAAVLVVVAGLAWGVQQVWEAVAPQVISRQRYRLPAKAITVTPQPAWITVSVRDQVIHNADLDGRLSILDPDFVRAIQDAFALHPWVEAVGRIEKKFPPAASVELSYRQPAAVVEIVAGGGVQLLPVDRRGVHLPAEDVPEIKRRYLPRIGGVVGQPPVGARWDDPRVEGAVDLAVRLAPLWEPLHLVEVLPSARPEVNGPRRYYVYDLVTRGGTRVVWGAVPSDSPPGESSFDEKLARLQQCVQRVGPLDSIRGPAVVDVRRRLQITPRTARYYWRPQQRAIASIANHIIQTVRTAAASFRVAVKPHAAVR